MLADRSATQPLAGDVFAEPAAQDFSEWPVSRQTAASPVGTGESLPAAGPAGLSGGRSRPAPAADPAAFASLAPADAAMQQFVADYLRLLDGRLDAIRRCLADSDLEGAKIAVLSLQSSSSMLGGDALVARLAELRSQLGLGSPALCGALFGLVEVAAAEFRATL